MSDSDKKEKNLFEQREEFLRMFTHSADFIRELMDENERLRYKVVQLEERVKASSTSQPQVSMDHAELLERIQKLESERSELHNRFHEVEEENQDFANRYVEVEKQNNNLANLYVASYQLHSTLNSHEVLEIVMEIIINLIGAEMFGVLLIDEKTNEIVPVKLEGIPPADFKPIRMGQGIIGDSAKTGEEYFVEEVAEYRFESYDNPMVVIPLKIKDRAIGALAIYKLLQQKEKFEDVDYELFTLLAGHAATAIFSSKLYSQAERKLTTMQGFIDLITK